MNAVVESPQPPSIQSYHAGTSSERNSYVSAPRVCVILIGGALAIVNGTSVAEPTKIWGNNYVTQSAATTSGETGRSKTAERNDSNSTSHAVAELRRLSGLTWDQLGELFSVSRRSVHFWASGKPLNAGNTERLMRVLSVIKDTYRGSAQETRAALFVEANGLTPFTLLANEHYAEAQEALGKGGTFAQLNADRPQISPKEQIARAPLPPEQLIGALNDRAHQDLGKGRAARTVRKLRSEG